MSTAAEHFDRVLDLLSSQQSFDALQHAERAHRLDPEDPYYLSYFGMLHALERGRVTEGIAMCQRAIDMAPHAGDLYINLARVYTKGGVKGQAVDVLRQGLAALRDDAALHHELQQLGLRRPLVFPSLPRSHFLNRWLGRLRHLLKGPITADEAVLLTRSA